MDQMDHLYVELQNYDRQGISIIIDDKRVDTFSAVQLCRLHEDNSFMRDYVFKEDGSLKQLRLDRVEPQKS